jgi:hypothetical protein
MQKTLYLATFDVGYTHILRVFYAADEAESQQKKSGLEKEINAVCKSLEHYPNGFRLVMSCQVPVCMVLPHLACSTIASLVRKEKQNE